jgi:hypothetical protein
MHIARLLGLFAVIPVSLLLALSFFVLFTLRKVDTERLKEFGYAVAVLLWISAFLIACMGAYVIATGRHPMLGMMQEMMKGHMQMMGGNMPGMRNAKMPATSCSSCKQRKMQMQEAIKKQNPELIQGQADNTTMKH